MDTEVGLGPSFSEDLVLFSFFPFEGGKCTPKQCRSIIHGHTKLMLGLTEESCKWLSINYL